MQKMLATKQVLYHTYFFHFCLNDTLIFLATKAIKLHVCSATNLTALSRKFKMTATTTFPAKVGNALTAFPASLLMVSGDLFNKFLKTSSSIDDKDVAGIPSPLNIPVRVSAVVQVIKERTISTDTIDISCSRYKVSIISVKDVYLSMSFSIGCLILANCV